MLKFAKSQPQWNVLFVITLRPPRRVHAIYVLERDVPHVFSVFFELYLLMLCFTERVAVNFWCSGHCFRGRPSEERLISAKWTPKDYNGDDSSNIQMRHLALTPDTQRDS